MQITFLVSQVNVHSSLDEVQDFVLPKVLVCWEFVSRGHVFRYHNKVLRTLFFGLTFNMKSPGGGSRRIRALLTKF